MKLAWALLRNAGTLFGSSLGEEAVSQTPEAERGFLLEATSALATSTVEVSWHRTDNAMTMSMSMCMSMCMCMSFIV